MTARSDLAALHDDALAALANRGLVKRSRKEVDRGDGPAIELLDDGTVVATFDDGVCTQLPRGVALSDVPCTCPATRVCRHRVAAVMAFRAQLPSSPPRGLEGRPALGVSDADLTERLGRRVFDQARRAQRGGMSVSVRLQDPPEVLLPTCTVRFLVPWELAHVHCDCTRAVDCAHVALAVWALRRVPDLASDGEHLVVFGEASQAAHQRFEGLETLLHDLLASGFSGALDGLHPRVARLKKELAASGAVWLVDLLDDLVGAMADYESSTQGADVRAVGQLLGELTVRLRTQPTAVVPHNHLHGEGGTSSTSLDHTTLWSLGPRLRRRDRTTSLWIHLREASAPDPLVLERRYTARDDAPGPDGPTLARRRLLKSTVATVATGRIVTRAATRRPNRRIDVAGTTQGQTSVVPSRGNGLAEVAEPLAHVRDRLAARPPEALCPRIRASRVALVRWSQVEHVAWDPGRQAVWGVVFHEGVQAMVTAHWQPETPGRHSALATALQPGPGWMSAVASLRAGQLWLSPLLVSHGDGAIAPDLAPETEHPTLQVGELPESSSAVLAAASGARTWLVESTRTGLSHLSASSRVSAQRIVEDLTAVGLVQTAAAVGAIGQAPSGGRPQAWGAAWARLTMVELAWARGELAR